jgi:hypothetical protein
MDRTTLATATSLTLMAMLSVPFAYAAGNLEQGTTDQVVKSQSDDQSQTKGADTKAGSPAKNGATKSPPAKHPPTAIMDQATPADKTATETKNPPGHGPTSVMDRAAPDQKSSGAAADSDAPAK